MADPNGYDDALDHHGVGPLLPCLVCGREFTPSGAQGNTTVVVNKYGTQQLARFQTPNDGVMISSYGNYGSTFWDSMDGDRMEFIVCDPCLRSRYDRLRFLRLMPRSPDIWEVFDANGAERRKGAGDAE